MKKTCMTLKKLALILTKKKEKKTEVYRGKEMTTVYQSQMSTQKHTHTHTATVHPPSVLSLRHVER